MTRVTESFVFFFDNKDENNRLITFDGGFWSYIIELEELKIFGITILLILRCHGLLN